MRRMRWARAVRAGAAAAVLAAGQLAPAAARAENAASAGQTLAVGKSALAAAEPLLDRLKLAADESEAATLEAQIWAAWGRSGDPAIDELMDRAGALMGIGRNEDALTLLDDVVGRAPDFAEGWNRRATLLYLMHEYSRSMADIERVLMLEPRHFGAVAGVGLIAIATGDRARALRAYSKVLEFDPQNANAKRMVDALSTPL